MVFMPPQHGKSELVSRQLPAKILGVNPKAKIVLASYSATLASSFNRDCQRIIDSDLYRDVYPGTFLNSSNIVTVSSSYLRNSEIFETVGHGGFLKTTGVGGSLTGTPADFAIIDDPVKDSLEASSVTYQERNWNWYNDVLYTRIHNNTGILITQTRWDENDLSGLLLKSMAAGTGEEWTILSLPAICEHPTDYDKREVGEALWPERHSLEKLVQVKKQSLRTFEALYQQNPRPIKTGGEFYKEFNQLCHVKPCKYNPAQPLHISFDFNRKPYMTMEISQYERVDVKDPVSGKVVKSYKYLRFIGEICAESPNNTSKGICKLFKLKFPFHVSGLFVYGDRNGKNEDTRSDDGHNDYRIIMSELAYYKPSQRVPSANPSVPMRGNFINDIFECNFGDIYLEIDPVCVNLIEDLQFTKEDVDGGKLKKMTSKPGIDGTFQKHGHTSDAMDYMICQMFGPEYEDFQRGPGGMSITQGKHTRNKTY